MSNFIAYIKTTSFRNNLIAAICTVAAILLIAFFSLRFYTKHGEGLDVPEVKGLTISQAVSKLEELGLRYEIDSVYVSDKPPGIVTDQDPDAGTFVKGNRTIYLTINVTQAPNVKFPDIEFKSLREAQAILESYRLKVGDTTYRPDVSRDVVLEALFGGQPIKAGEVLPTGSRISLILGDGRGNEDVELPNLIGFTLDEAPFFFTWIYAKLRHDYIRWFNYRFGHRSNHYSISANSRYSHESENWFSCEYYHNQQETIISAYEYNE